MVDPKNVRKRRSYKKYQEILVFLKKGPNLAEILQFIYKMATTEKTTEHSKRLTLESLDLIIEDNRLEQLHMPKIVCRCGSTVVLENRGGLYPHTWIGTCRICNREYEVTTG